MRKSIFFILLFFLSLISKGESKNIFVIPIKGEISKASERILDKGFKAAGENNSHFIILQINTYGGAVSSADSMRSKILRFEKPVIAYIDNQAVSAGALISIACDSIYMTTGSTIGAATVVNQTGEPMPDKYQSFMRAMMRSTAEAKGRDPLIAEAMVDPQVVVPYIMDDSLKVVSFTMSEAIKYNYCEGEANTIEDVAVYLTHDGEYTINYMKISPLDKIISFLLSSIVQGILLMVIIGGIYFELQTPGVGFPSLAALIAALLYFSPLYLEGLADNWEIIIFIIGVLLILAEIFIIPGFGVAGISGILLTITGLVFAMIDNDLFYFNGIINFRVILKPLSIVLLSAFFSFISSIWLVGRLFPGKSFSHLSLKTELYAHDGYVSSSGNLDLLVGKMGRAASSMRPAGKVEIDGKWYDATIEFGMANRGEEVVVTRIEGGRLYCERLPQ